MLTGPPALATADPPPRPPGRTQGAHGSPVRHPGHPVVRGHSRAAQHRPRTVARCQHDETDQVEEIDDDGDMPQQATSPVGPAPGGHCAGRDALIIKRILGLPG